MSGITVLLAAMSLGYGGAETHAIGLAQVLSQRGHRVLVASQGGPLVSELGSLGIPHFNLPLHSRNPLRLARAVREMRAILDSEKVDLIHAHARIPAWVAESARSRRAVVPLVTTYHGVYSSGIPWRWVTRWGDRVIAVSPDVATHLTENLGLSGRVPTIIPNGIDTSRFRPGLDETGARQALGLPPHGAVVTHVSRLDGRMGEVALALIEAVELLARDCPTITAVIVGTGDRREEIALRAGEINRQLGREAVLLEGGQRDLVPYLTASTAVVAVARSALEAAACGKPVIIAGEGGFRGPLSRANAALLEQHNFTARGSGTPVTARELARCLGQILENPQMGQDLGSFGQSLVEGEFNLDAVVDRIESVYREVLDP